MEGKKGEREREGNKLLSDHLCGIAGNIMAVGEAERGNGLEIAAALC